MKEWIVVPQENPESLKDPNFINDNFMMNYVPQSSPSLRIKPKIHKKKFRKALDKDTEQSQREGL